MENKNNSAPRHPEGGQAELDPAQMLEELRSLRARERDWVFQGDLARIAKAFPQQAPDSIPALGDDFLKMRSLGIDPVTAFAAICLAQNGAVTPPPEMGPAACARPEQDFYSPEEVRRMTPQQVQQNLKKIERSQKKW